MLDDYPWVHYTVRYNALYIKPLVGDIICKHRVKLYHPPSLDGVIQDIQLSHLSMLVYNTLTTLVLFDALDNDRFDIVNNEEELDDDSNAEAEQILASGPLVVR